MQRYTTWGPRGRLRPIDRVELGPGLPEGLDRRLLGDLTGRRILDLGCGCGNSAVAMAKAGAKVVAVDTDPAQLHMARELSEAQEVRIELHNADLADLAFLRAETFDAALSVYELVRVDDLDRLFRQVHRVLHPDAPFVISLPHPVFQQCDTVDPTRLVARYHSDTPVTHGGPIDMRLRTSDVFGGLTRANFRVDVLLEPEPPDPAGLVPETLVIRGRKEGK